MSDIQKEYGPKGVAVVGGTIDPSGLVGLQDYVERFRPMFPIGAMDQATINSFGQWGPKRTLVPMLFLIDKNGVVQGQFMGGEPIFEGDKVGNLRTVINHMMSSSANAPKKSVTASKK